MSAITNQPGVFPHIFTEYSEELSGLHYLNTLDRLEIKQKVELCEALSGFETKNRYQVLDSFGQDVFFMSEETDCCTRNLCGQLRPFTFHVTDNLGKEVLQFSRGLSCTPFGWPNCYFCLCCLSCGTNEMSITSMGSAVGTVKWENSCGIPSLCILDKSGKVIFNLESECCQCSFGSSIEYKIIDSELQVEVGQIAKEFNGFLMECLTDADNFVIHFPVGIDMYQKALLLGATISIDFMFYETKNSQ